MRWRLTGEHHAWELRGGEVPMGAKIATVVILLGVASTAGAKKPVSKSAPVNVTGTFNTTFAGAPEAVLRQKGNVVYGKVNGNYVRGDWSSDGQLTLFVRDPFQADGNECGKPFLYVFTSKGVVSKLDGVTWNDAGEIADAQALVRKSPDGGSEFEYPYAAELKDCHTLIAHELVFASGSDKLEGKDWPALAGTAAALQKDAALKITILGHTDSTGDAEANKTLSKKRAEAVKQVLVKKYSIASARINTDGMGQEQPLVPNSSAEGRSVNRRVEILMAH
jgi:outer membrane protein OmpA-like peptidoglycan-associated protein